MKDDAVGFLIFLIETLVGYELHKLAAWYAEASKSCFFATGAATKSMSF